MLAEEQLGPPPKRAGAPFSGSYRADQTNFLLTPMEVADTPVREKERLIQAGRHYSEMLTLEGMPTRDLVRRFEHLTHMYRGRLAAEINALAAAISADYESPVTIVSFARAGTPIGALLSFALARIGRPAPHYSISIIRDRGVDEHALAYLLRDAGRPPEGIIFVDGWTAKGVIAQELHASVARWNARNPEQLEPRLHVVADLGGTADVSATLDDYAIPSGIMNATVSGLVSRSVLNSSTPRGGFHGCVYYEHLEAVDRTQWFYEQVSRAIAVGEQGRLTTPAERATRRDLTRLWLESVMGRLRITNKNRVKPGVAEATRAVLRRSPEQVLVRDRACPDVIHLVELAVAAGVPLAVDAEMPFNAVTIIQPVG